MLTATTAIFILHCIPYHPHIFTGLKGPAIRILVYSSLILTLSVGYIMTTAFNIKESQKNGLDSTADSEWPTLYLGEFGSKHCQKMSAHANNNNNNLHTDIPYLRRRRHTHTHTHTQITIRYSIFSVIITSAFTSMTSRANTSLRGSSRR